MFANSKRRTIVALALLAMMLIAAETRAACSSCGTSAFYPSTYSANYGGWYGASYPATYQTYYANTSWYPGYYWDRARTRLWGSPTTYVAAYPTTAYYAASVPSYSVAYSAPSCSSCSTCQSCTAGYAPCSSCSTGCNTCGVQTVTLRPVCTTACSTPCSTCTSGCSTCSSHVVTQTSYEQPACSSCAASDAVLQVQQESSAPTSTPDPAPPTFDPNAASSGSTSTAPGLPPDTNVPPERREEQKPPTNGTGTQPGPVEDTTETPETPEGDFYKKLESSDSATMFEAPKLHDPNDRTAWRPIAPVKSALYVQPASYRNVTAQRVTIEQVRQDAIGWSSVSK